MENSNITMMQGDLLKQEVTIMGHQTNCLGIMGGGIAYAVRQKFPQVYEVYHTLCKMNQKNRQNILGTCQLVATGDSKIPYVANLFGEDDFKKGGMDTIYPALESALVELRDQAHKMGNVTIGLPYRLGCGLAGGDWNVVYGLIEKVFKGDPNINVLICAL